MKVRKAKVVEVFESERRETFTGPVFTKSGVWVEDETGDRHCLYDGSLNGIARGSRHVGVTGTVRYETGGSFALWVFVPDQEEVSNG